MNRFLYYLAITVTATLAAGVAATVGYAVYAAFTAPQLSARDRLPTGTVVVREYDEWTCDIELGGQPYLAIFFPGRNHEAPRWTFTPRPAAAGK